MASCCRTPLERRPGPHYFPMRGRLRIGGCAARVGGSPDVNFSFLQELLSTIADQGRALLPRSLFGAGAEADVEELARVLISGRGEASGGAIAGELLDRLQPPA